MSPSAAAMLLYATLKARFSFSLYMPQARQETRTSDVVCSGVVGGFVRDAMQIHGHDRATHKGRLNGQL